MISISTRIAGLISKVYRRYWHKRSTTKDLNYGHARATKLAVITCEFTNGTTSMVKNF